MSARHVINRSKALLRKHNSGNPEDELSDEQIAELQEMIEAGEAYLEDHADDGRDAYDKDDPKHPTYTERALDNADYERKRRREEGE